MPSIANLYLRWWAPLEEGRNRREGWGPELGEHTDGFGNKVTLWAVANPSEEPAGGDRLTTRAAGFGVVRLRKSERTIRFECWPRNVEIGAEGAAPYPGWPVQVDQLDNYARAASGWLPTLVVEDYEEPVIEVEQAESGELVYALRIQGSSFRPPVYGAGPYRVRVRGGGRELELEGLVPLPESASAELRLRLRP